MIWVGLHGSFPMLNCRGAVTRMLHVLPEEVLCIGVIGLQRHNFLQEFGGALDIVFLFCRKSQEIERSNVIRLQTNRNTQFLICIFVLAGLEEETAEIVMGGGELGIQSGCLGKLLEPISSVKLIDQRNPQVQMSLRGIRFERQRLLK